MTQHVFDREKIRNQLLQTHSHYTYARTHTHTVPMRLMFLSLDCGRYLQRTMPPPHNCCLEIELATFLSAHRVAMHSNTVIIKKNIKFRMTETESVAIVPSEKTLSEEKFHSVLTVNAHSQSWSLREPHSSRIQHLSKR